MIYLGRISKLINQSSKVFNGEKKNKLWFIFGFVAGVTFTLVMSQML